MAGLRIVLILFCALSFSTFTAFSAEDPDPLSFGCMMDKMMVANHTLVLDYQLEKTISGIGDRLTRVSDRRLGQYTYRIVEKPTIDAFSLAGGYIYLNTGLLDFIDNEDMLAFVLAHEISHANFNHQIEYIKAERRRVRNAQLLSDLIGFASQIGGAYVQVRYGNTIAGQMGGEMLRVLGPEISASACGAVALSAIKGYSRKQELEADSNAIVFMDRAGYDPQAFIVLLEKLLAARDRLTAQKTPAVSNLINSDPGLELRLQQAKSQLARTR